MNKLLFLLVTQLGCVASIFAQPVAEALAHYPNTDYLALEYHQKLIINSSSKGLDATTEYNRDILIASKTNANAYGKYKIYHSTFNELKDLDAYSKIPQENGKYKKVKIADKKTTASTSNSIFYDDTKETSFYFEGLITNSIQHLEYSLYHSDAHFIPAFYLQSSYPIYNASFTIEVPKTVNMAFHVRNNESGILTYSKEETNKTIIHKWTASKTKEITNYNNGPDDRYFEPHVVPYITDYTIKDEQQDMFKNVDALYKWNYSHIKDINTTEEQILKELAATLTKDKKTDVEKVESVYNWVQANIKYVAFESGLEGLIPRQAADVCNKRYGDCKDMSSIITKLLQLAGLKAHFTWIGTRSLPYAYAEVPTPIVDNHMISAVSINDKWYFLDGTDPNSIMDLPPSGIQGKQALIAISPNAYKIETVPVSPSKRSLILDSTFINITNKGVSGKQKVKYTGYFGSDFYTSWSYKNEIEKENYIKSRTGKASNKFLLGKYDVKKTDEANREITIDADYEIPGFGKKIGNEFFINLNLEKLMENSQIELEKRKVAIENEYLYIIEQHHILNLPPGYKASYVPENFYIENDFFKYSIEYVKTNTAITATQKKELKKLMIPPSDFAKWNEACSQIEKQYREQVVIVK